MSVITRFSLLLTMILLCAGLSNAQGDRPQALLRVNEDLSAPDSKRFYVEILADTPLQQSVYDSLNGAYPPRLGVLASKGIPLPDSGSFRNTLVPSPGGDRTHFRIYLPESMAPFADFDKKKFTVILTNYVDQSGANQIRGINVEKVFTRELATDFPVCQPEQFSIHFDYDPADEYSKKRATQLYRTLKTLKMSPAQLALIRIQVEPLTKKDISELTVIALTLSPENESQLDNSSTVTACLDTGGHVPTEKFDAKLDWNNKIPVELVEPQVVVGVSAATVESPSSVFVDKEKAVGVRPIDKDLNLAVSLVSSVSDNEKPNKQIVRERTTRGTLDLRLGLFRNVEQLTVRNPFDGWSKACGLVQSFTPALGATPATLVLNDNTYRIVPGIDLGNVKPKTQQCFHFYFPPEANDADGNPVFGEHNPFHPTDPSFRPKITPLEAPNLTRGTYSIFTPFYLDAKVSTGKIEKDTLSLNRVVFGTQEELRYYANNFRYPTYYRFVFQGNHASDRDFKQKEYKGTFEFRPVFGSLNHPYDPDNATTSPRQLCQTCKQKFKLVPINHGFEFVPLIGAEIGRTYSRRRPAAAIEPSATVRRLYFGLDGVLNPSARLALTASEVFYIRGESKTDRYHNYFLGEASYKIGAFLSGKVNHSIFFSWERGGQPPFEDADVNALKFGYRMTSTTLFSR